MHDYQPLVSVIINCFNGEKYLRDAIDSVVNQTYTNWEMIFWDNQSTDSTAEIVKSYNNDKIHYYYALTHTTLGEARNLAVEKANGEYINFLDADDYWSLHKLEKQIEIIEPGKCDVVYTHFKLKIEGEFGANKSMSRYYERIQNYRPDSSKSVYQNLLYKNWIIFSSVLLSKALYYKVGGINPLFKQNEDYEILLKCSLETEIRNSQEALVTYRVHSCNNSTANKLVFIEENRIIYSQLPESIDLSKAKSELEVRHCFNLIREHKYLQAITHFISKGNLTALLSLIDSRLNDR